MQVSLFAVPPERHGFWRVKRRDGLPQVEHPDAAPHRSHPAQHPHHHPRQQAPQPRSWRRREETKTRGEDTDSTRLLYSWTAGGVSHAHQSPVWDLGTRTAFWAACILQKKRRCPGPQSPAKMAAGLRTGRRRSGRRGAVGSDPSLRPRRESPAHSSTERRR